MRRRSENALRLFLRVCAGMICTYWLLSLAACDTGRVFGPKVMTVCDLLNDLPAHRGQMVAVRGVYHYGELWQDDCARPFMTGRHRWPPALDLVESDSADPRYPVRFTTELKDWDDLDRLCVRQGELGRRVDVWATFVGQLRARQKYEVTGQPDRWFPGYGHSAALPAQIVVLRVSDVVVKPNPVSKHDYKLRQETR